MRDFESFIILMESCSITPTSDVTGKAIEETAAVVLRLYHDRKQKCTMTRISKRY